MRKRRRSSLPAGARAAVVRQSTPHKNQRHRDRSDRGGVFLFGWKRSGDGPERIPAETKLFPHSRAERREKSTAKTRRGRLPFRHSKTRREPVALRFSAGNGRRSKIVGGAERTAMEARRKASRSRGRGSPDRVRGF